MDSSSLFKSVHHISLTVGNLERSLDFYVRVLGFPLVLRQDSQSEYLGSITGFSKVHIRMAHLQLPGTNVRLELFEYLEPLGQKADMRTMNTGSAHICFLVTDLPAIYERLKAQGIPFRSPPVAITSGANRGGYSVYFEDPDGITLELFQPPE
ncbi:MAG: VOC family protein [Chloroflexi bacterium]|nr:VOC family protein [Chloroflexota bacterium]